MVQWLDALRWHVAPSVTSTIVLARQELSLYDVPPQGLYAAVRDHLLDSSGEKYHPLAYLERLDNMKAGQLTPSELATQMNKVLALYEAARKRHIFKLQRFPEISARCAAWL